MKEPRTKEHAVVADCRGSATSSSTKNIPSAALFSLSFPIKDRSTPVAMGWLTHLTTGNKKNDESSVVVEDENSSRRPDYMVQDIDASTYQQNTVASTQRAGVLSSSQPALMNMNQQQQQNKGLNNGEINPSASETATCGQRFCSEIHPCRNNWFQVKDPVNGRIIDIPESFAPASCRALWYKLFYCTLCVGTIVYTIIEYDYNKGFYFAYLTYWGAIFCCGYSILSLFNTVFASRTGQPGPDGTVSCRIRTTWILFALSAQTSFVTMILFWALQFDPADAVIYSTIVPHGVLFIFTVIDGLYVNRIPLRLMHWYGFILPFDIAYITWTIIQSFFDIENPAYDTDPTTNDDAIYAGVLEWSNDWTTALFWSLITIFVIGPLLYILLWTMSFGNFCCVRCGSKGTTDSRKYVDSVDPYDTRPTVADVEEGSIFAGWK